MRGGTRGGVSLNDIISLAVAAVLTGDILTVLDDPGLVFLMVGLQPVHMSR